LTSHRRRLLSFLMTLFAIAGLISSQASTASTLKVVPFEPLNNLFHAYGDLEAGADPRPRVWTGGDSTFSVVLPDGRTVWIFSDTFLSPNGPCDSPEPTPCHNRTLFVAPLVNNSFVVQERQTLTSTLYREPPPGSAEPPGALIKPPVPNDARSYYWMGDGVVEGDKNKKLHVFVHRYPVTTGGVVPPSAEATDVATFSLPSLTLDGITEGVSAAGVRPWAFAAPPLESEVPVTWGAAILEDGEHVYVYGTEEYPLHKFLHVARVPVGQLLSAPWVYYTGTGSGWSADPLLSTRILEDVAGELSIVKTTAGYRLVASSLGIGDIVAHEGTAPFGPWGERIPVYSPPEGDPPSDDPDSEPTGFAYNAKEHPQLSCRGNSVISYNVNGTVNRKDAFADIHVYRPRFIEVSGLTPVACPSRRSLWMTKGK
jgi:hypothetical protein